MRRASVIVAVAVVVALAGCISSSPGFAELAKNHPEVNAFLEEHPNADMSVVLWRSNRIQNASDVIDATCRPALQVEKDHYRVHITEQTENITAWIEADARQVVCVNRETGGSAGTDSANEAGGDEEDDVVQNGNLKNVDLAAHWTFDEVSDGKVTDNSGNDNTGYIRGDPEIIEGVEDQALRFDGEDDYVRANITPELQLGSDFQLGLWFKKPSRYPEVEAVLLGLYTYEGSGHGEQLELIVHGQNRTNFAARHSDGYGLNAYFGIENDAAPRVTTNSWHKLRLEYSEKGEFIAFYVDEDLAHNMSAPESVRYDDSYLTIGASPHNDRAFSQPFKGAVDEVKIYSGEQNKEETTESDDGSESSISCSYANIQILDASFDGSSVTVAVTNTGDKDLTNVSVTAFAGSQGIDISGDRYIDPLNVGQTKSTQITSSGANPDTVRVASQSCSDVTATVRK